MNICLEKYLDQQMLINALVENWYIGRERVAKEHISNITQLVVNYFRKKNSIIVVSQATKCTLVWVSRLE